MTTQKYDFGGKRFSHSVDVIKLQQTIAYLVDVIKLNQTIVGITVTNHNYVAKSSQKTVCHIIGKNILNQG